MIDYEGGCSMTLNQLLYFHRAASLEHFNLAAESLHISEPSLSRSINSLEQELGVSLFEKTGRNIVLTKAGKLFLEQTDKILEDVSSARALMNEYTTHGGHIDIAYVAPLAHRILPSVIGAFRAVPENQKISFNFFEGYTDQNIKGLMERHYDLIFGSVIESSSEIRSIPFFRQEMVVLLPADSPLAGEETDLDATIFGSYPNLRYDPRTGLGKATRRFFEAHNIISSGETYFPDEASLAAFVAGGFGIALAADSESVHRPGVVIRHLIPEQRFYNTVYMAYLSQITLMPAVRKMIDFIENDWDKDQNDL